MFDGGHWWTRWSKLCLLRPQKSRVVSECKEATVTELTQGWCAVFCNGWNSLTDPPTSDNDKFGREEIHELTNMDVEARLSSFAVQVSEVKWERCDCLFQAELYCGTRHRDSTYMFIVALAHVYVAHSTLCEPGRQQPDQVCKRMKEGKFSSCRSYGIVQDLTSEINPQLPPHIRQPNYILLYIHKYVSAQVVCISGIHWYSKIYRREWNWPRLARSRRSADLHSLCCELLSFTTYHDWNSGSTQGLNAIVCR